MRIFAISDTHLSTAVDKPMAVFGTRWKNHEERIRQNWECTVSEEDIVVIPGDISWGLKFDEVMPDFDWLHNLCGLKIITKGNHDLWWTSLSKLNNIHDDMIFLHNNYYDAGGIAICGTRGWNVPQIASEWTEHDEKIFRRECQRLENALKAASEINPEKIIVAVHYPPTDSSGRSTAFTDIIERYGASEVIYGHLHGEDAAKNAFTGKKSGIRYRLVSSDCINFTPVLIYDSERRQL